MSTRYLRLCLIYVNVSETHLMIMDDYSHQYPPSFKIKMLLLTTKNEEITTRFKLTSLTVSESALSLFYKAAALQSSFHFENIKEECC